MCNSPCEYAKTIIVTMMVSRLSHMVTILSIRYKVPALKLFVQVKKTLSWLSATPMPHIMTLVIITVNR